MSIKFIPLKSNNNNNNQNHNNFWVQVILLFVLAAASTSRELTNPKSQVNCCVYKICIEKFFFFQICIHQIIKAISS